jgi:hypothetical protein
MPKANYVRIADDDLETSITYVKSGESTLTQYWEWYLLNLIAEVRDLRASK